MRSAVSGVSSAGLSTTVLPAASAGANAQPAIGIGKFHGTIAPTTPSGSWKVTSTPAGDRDLPAAQPFRRPGVVGDHVADVAGLPPRVADGVPGVLDLQRGQPLDVRVDRVGEPAQQPGPVAGGHAPATPANAARGPGDGRVGAGQVGRRDGGDDRLGRRVDDLGGRGHEAARRCSSSVIATSCSRSSRSGSATEVVPAPAHQLAQLARRGGAPRRRRPPAGPGRRPGPGSGSGRSFIHDSAQSTSSAASQCSCTTEAVSRARSPVAQHLVLQPEQRLAQLDGPPAVPLAQRRGRRGEPRAMMFL